jgi:hypothetical protein
MEGTISVSRLWLVLAALLIAFGSSLLIRPLIGIDRAEATIRSPQVICITEWGDQPTGAYRYRPHQCDIHERGAFPVFHLNVSVLRRLHWLHWGPKSAVARGKLGISTYGLAPIKLRLLKPRTLCDHTTFTEMIMRGRVPYGGKPHPFRDRKKIDTCLR